jgi:hypothetical protein
MGPGGSRFWLPLTRLGVFFGAIVVAGNFMFQIFRPVAADLPPAPDEPSDFIGEKKRQLHRIMNQFFGPRASSVPERKSSVVTVEAASTVAPGGTPTPEITPPATPRAEALGYLEPELPSFVWPLPLEHRPFELPGSIGQPEAVQLRADLVSEWYRRGRAVPGSGLGNVLLLGPGMLIDGIFACASGMSPRPEIRTWEEEDNRCIAARALEFRIGPLSDRTFAELTGQWAEGERGYLAHFEDSRARSVSLNDPLERAALREFSWDQRKVFWDALRRTYLARRKVDPEERIRDDAWYSDRWQGVDYVMLPPLVGGYLYYRGLDKRFPIGTTDLHLSLEPISEWVRRKRDIATAASIEWSMGEFPLRVIVSAGVRDSRYVCDFAGIGTSLAAVRMALVMQQEVDRR